MQHAMTTIPLYTGFGTVSIHGGHFGHRDQANISFEQRQAQRQISECNELGSDLMEDEFPTDELSELLKRTADEMNQDGYWKRCFETCPHYRAMEEDEKRQKQQQKQRRELLRQEWLRQKQLRQQQKERQYKLMQCQPKPQQQQQQPWIFDHYSCKRR